MNEFKGYLEESMHHMVEDTVKETEADIVSLLITKGELNAAWIVAKSSGFTRAGFDNLVDIWANDRYNFPADHSDVEILQMTRERADAMERLKASKYWFNWWTEKFNDNPSVHNSDDLRLAMLRYQKDFAEVERLDREIHELMSESFHPAEIQSVMDNLL